MGVCDLPCCWERQLRLGDKPKNCPICNKTVYEVGTFQARASYVGSVFDYAFQYLLNKKYNIKTNPTSESTRLYDFEIQNDIVVESKGSPKYVINPDARTLLKMGKERTGKIPSVFMTDGLPAYNDAFKKEYARKNYLSKPSKHIKEIHFKNQRRNNNIQERLNGEFRDREKTFRGLKKTDSPAIAGIKLYHNYIRPTWVWTMTHQLTGMESKLKVTTNGRQ